MATVFKTLTLWVPRIVDLTERYPWAMPLFGFCSGLASFFLVERKEEIAQLIAILMLASWVWLMVEKFLRRFVSSWFGLQLPSSLMNYFAQLVHQESLFFIIPFFFITTSWNSGQMVFTGLLLVSAFVSIIDPLYFRWLAPRRWLYFCFHGITLFAVLLTALPILFQIPTAKSYFWSLAIALAITLPSVANEMRWSWWKRILAVVMLGAVTAASAYLLRPWVPPATLWLTQVAITDHIDNRTRSPDKVLKVISPEQLHQGLYAYTAIHAPRGLNERIYHEWRLNGRLIDKVPLDINGGRAAGYRAWSHKQNFPAHALGRWQIKVVTEANQVIGILRFQVVDSAEKIAAAESSASPTGITPAPVTADDAMKSTIMKIVEEEQ
ncbi:DUF5924 family protein [Cellvibrio sp. NN19]|uniref:DUF5924 family protein n=1 Tax=Cellvibrio chitinivorans TaxID=3102792 RepID=UPI002B401051|nr:DUF5924 family protein [Cellvibrio sp. NN19]